MNPILDYLVPPVLFLLMFIVGAGLTPSEFRHVRDRPITIVLATLAQVILLPALAASLVWILEPRPHIAAGLVLAAACPGGALSNYYCLLARADVALSVVLTAVASLASLVTLPVAISLGFALLGNQDPRVSVPVARILLQLVVFVLLPIGMGMVTRSRWPVAMTRWLPGLNRIGLGALIGILVVVFVNQAGALSGEFLSVILLAVMFTVLSFMLGASLGWVLRFGSASISSLGLEFSVRNLAIMALVAVSTFGRVEYLLFGAVFVVVQFPIAILAARLLRRVA